MFPGQRKSQYEQASPEFFQQEHQNCQNQFHEGHNGTGNGYNRPAATIPAQELSQQEVQEAAQSQSIYQQMDDGTVPQNVTEVSSAQKPSTAPQSFGVEGYNYQYSNCTGRRKALLIGINYIGTNVQLKGCINDVNNVKQFLIQHGYTEDNIVMLSDDQEQMVKVPMRATILKAIQWLVKDAQPNDSLFFHYSGHGSQVRDEDGDEEDAIDETIVPLDYTTNGQITDDELHAKLVMPLPAGVRLTALFDSCHSGSVLDLPYMYSTKGVLKQPNLAKEAGEGLLSAAKSYIQGDQAGMMAGLKALGSLVLSGGPDAEAYQKTIRTKTAPADVVMFSGSKDDQTSADANEGGVPTGAMSYAFMKVMNNAPQQTYLSLLKNMREVMETKYTQKPQFSASHPIDVNLQFIF